MLSISIDCPALQSLALNLNRNVVGDCCTATGITCVSQRVTQISWNNKNLYGAINQTAINALTELTDFIVSNNRIMGSMPAFWPSKLKRIVLASNNINGLLSQSWPANLNNLLLELNHIQGNISGPFPSSLLELNLGANAISGPIPSNLPSGLSSLHLDSNRFYGVLPCDFPKNLQDLRLNENAGLYGDISDIIPFNIQNLWLGRQGYNYGTAFSGQIIVNHPVEFYVSLNQITNIVIYNTSQLTGCEISQNPLLGNLNIANLTVCLQTGLFTPSSTTLFRSFTCASTQAILNTIQPTSAFPDNDTESSPILKFVASPLFFIAIGIFLGVCILVLIIGRLVKTPKSNSKFGRKNSFGTLNTTASSVKHSRTTSKLIF